jgi:hypothetical protein
MQADSSPSRCCPPLGSLITTVVPPPRRTPARGGGTRRRGDGGREACSLRTDRRMRTDPPVSDPSATGAKPARPGELDPPFYGSGTRNVFSDYARQRQRTTLEGSIFGGQPSRLLGVQSPDSIRIANLTLRTRNAFPAGPRSAPVGQFQIEGLIRRRSRTPTVCSGWGLVRRAIARSSWCALRTGMPFAFRFVFDRSTGLPLAMETDNDDPVRRRAHLGSRSATGGRSGQSGFLEPGAGSTAALSGASASPRSPSTARSPTACSRSRAARSR